MRKIQKFVVSPNIPKELQPILNVANNLWWTWNPSAIELFRWIDSTAWRASHHNPVKMLGMVKPERFEKLKNDEAFLSQMENVNEDLKDYMKQTTWFEKNYKDKFKGTIAYFSFEFGIHESLSLYSGGLGVLSGDHMKSSSDLGLPLVGVGLLYRYGYFHQYLNVNGWQQESYIENDFENMPMTLVLDKDKNPILIPVEYPGRVVYAQVWKLQVGRVRLFLLDTDIEVNTPDEREITYKLYGGDLHTRIQQEILLGIGGVRALEVMGIEPAVCHMNEGHSSFLVFERTRSLMKKYNIGFNQAKDMVSAGSIFTTHTPVPAGIDNFPPEMIASYFGDYCKKLGISIGRLVSYGRVNPQDNNEYFSMPILAFNFCNRANGVSKLHGEVARTMWKSYWPNILESQIPLVHVTNGIHTKTWLSDEFGRLYGRYLGLLAMDDPDDLEQWEKVENIPDSEIWSAKERLRERLIAFARRRLKEQMGERGAASSKLEHADEILNPRALTIGFARRFATYKRANLLFRDLKRLERILNNRDRPVQIIFSGKAHPKDDPGKKLIQQVYQVANMDQFRRSIVFLDDYNMDIARYLVQGVDVWLNTPTRPQEASGTSGMKVPANGGLNLSILDGWWVEGYNGKNGWAIGSGEVYSDTDYQNEIEAKALYELLEKEVIPTFYDRSIDNVPRKWTRLMKDSMKSLPQFFNTNRMVSEYFRKMYDPADGNLNELSAYNGKKAVEMCKFKDKIDELWDPVNIENVYVEKHGDLKVGMKLEVEAQVELGDLSPDDVAVELYYGHLDAAGDLSQGGHLRMKYTNVDNDGKHVFTCTIPCTDAGRNGYVVAIYPDTDGLCTPYELRNMKWWGE